MFHPGQSPTNHKHTQLTIGCLRDRGSIYNEDIRDLLGADTKQKLEVGADLARAGWGGGWHQVGSPQKSRGGIWRARCWLRPEWGLLNLILEYSRSPGCRGGVNGLTLHHTRWGWTLPGVMPPVSVVIDVL